jgi:hypothetical protein
VRDSKQAEALIAGLEKALAPLRDFHDRLLKTIELNQDKIASAAERALVILQGIQTMARDLPEHMRMACSELAAHGWYIDGDFGAGFAGDLVRALRAGNHEWVNAQLIADYRERLPTIKAALFECYPRRVKILSATFVAHERGEYELSVPVFLAQADGICLDVTKQSMFRKDWRSGKPAVAQYAESFDSDEFHSAVLAPLKVVHSIALSEKERRKGFGGPNRHQVLHGEVVDYGTELNSFKAISLLSYLSWVLRLDAERALGR